MNDELIDKILAGNREAYRALMEKHQDMLSAYVAWKMPIPSLRDEVLQQSFIRAFEQLADFRRDQDFDTWLRSISFFEIKTEIKKAKRERVNLKNYRDHLELRLLNFHEKEEDRENSLQAMKLCLKSLQGHSQELIDLRYTQELSSPEFSNILLKGAGCLNEVLGDNIISMAQYSDQWNEKYFQRQ